MIIVKSSVIGNLNLKWKIPILFIQQQKNISNKTEENLLKKISVAFKLLTPHSSCASVDLFKHTNRVNEILFDILVPRIINYSIFWSWSLSLKVKYLSLELKKYNYGVLRENWITLNSWHFE